MWGVMRLLILILAMGCVYFGLSRQVNVVMHELLKPRPPQLVVVENHHVDVPAGISLGTFEATAYTDGPESTGKQPGHPAYGVTYSGLPTRPGVVAVDPEVVPLGSVLWVEGYGIAVALDTGGAIQGMRIDVWFEDLDDALAWGRREVQVVRLL